jgi:hypothetical protein
MSGLQIEYSKELARGVDKVRGRPAGGACRSR